MKLRHRPHAVASMLAAPLTAAAVEPTNLEQYMLEIINRARADGNAEAARFGLSSVNEGNPSINGQSWTIQPVAPPLTWNEQLTNAARGQAQALFAAAFLSGDPHTYGGKTPQQRIAAAGFVTCSSCPRTTTTSGYRPGVENFAFAARSPGYTAAQLQAEIPAIHRRLFADSTTGGRLHRITIMDTWFREIGLGMAYGPVGSSHRIYFMMDFDKAAPGTRVFLTGVAYRDTITADQFYTPGEGLGAHKVQAWQSETKVAEATTWASGGYRLPLAAGTYQIRLVNAGGNMSDMGRVVIGSENVKRDSRNPVFVPPPVRVNLRISRHTAGSLTIQWDDPAWSLAGSGSLSGPWSIVATASPATITIQPGGKRFFRCQR